MSRDQDSAALLRLVTRAQNGDRVALEQLLARCQPTLVRMAGRLVRDADAAQDVAQEGLIRIAERLGQLAEPAAFWGWARTILQREAVEHFRRQQRERIDASVDPDSVAEIECEDPARTFAVNQEIERCLRRLQQQDRRVLSLHYWYDLEVREIAGTLGIAVGAVKTRLFRARSRLRELLCEPEVGLASQR